MRFTHPLTPSAREGEIKGKSLRKGGGTKCESIRKGWGTKCESLRKGGGGGGIKSKTLPLREGFRVEVIFTMTKILYKKGKTR